MDNLRNAGQEGACDHCRRCAIASSDPTSCNVGSWPGPRGVCARGAGGSPQAISPITIGCACTKSRLNSRTRRVPGGAVHCLASRLSSSASPPSWVVKVSRNMIILGVSSFHLTLSINLPRRTVHADWGSVIGHFRSSFCNASAPCADMNDDDTSRCKRFKIGV